MRILELLMRETLPQKEFFQASEASELLDITTHDMGFWETEFPQVRPQKTSSGKRLYRRQDLVLFSAIKHLLVEKGLSVDDAQRIIAESDDLFSTPATKSEPLSESLMVSDNADLNDDDHDDEQILVHAESEDFDVVTKEIYGHVGEQLVVSPQPPQPVPILVEALAEATIAQCREDYEKKLATLKESKASLTAIISMLDKFDEGNFWRGFKD